MKLNLVKKTAVIFGYRGGGKSVLAHFIATPYGQKALVYDTLNEVPENAKFHSYSPKNREDITEFSNISRLVLHNHYYKIYIIDEANRFCKPKPTPLPQVVSDLNDWCRHKPYELGVVYIARRPVQLNTDLVELADYIFIFQLGGKNDIQYFNDLSAGLGDTVCQLKPYHFCLVMPNRSYQVMPPITPSLK